MGRNISYDINAVLRRAALLFRERGFHNTSVQDVVEATGINRFAIYEKFGGKEGLFHATLDFYVEVPLKRELLAPLRGEDVSLDSLLQVLEKMRAINLDLTQPAGCLITNASIEMAGRDPKVDDAVEAFCAAFRNATAHVVRLALLRGEIKGDCSVEQRADYLATMVNAIMVTAPTSRASADKLMAILLDEVQDWRSQRSSAGYRESLQ